MIDPVLEWLLSATVRASVLAVVIVAIQTALRRWLPAGRRYALWLPMLLALVLPVLFTVPIRILPRRAVKLVETAEVANPNDVYMVMRRAVVPDQGGAASQSGISLKQAMMMAWALGAGLILAAGLVGYRRSIRRVRQGAIVPDETLAQLIESAARQAGLKRGPETIISPAVESPAVTGFFRPVLLLPAGFPDGFTAAESRMILLHEFTHLKRWDLPVNWIAWALQALHWFNPVLWFAFARMRADRETACDAQVLSLGAADARSDYGMALLKLQLAVPAGSLRLGFVGIFERRADLKSRIVAISGHRRNQPAWGMGGAALLALMTFLGVINAEEPEAIPSVAELSSANAATQKRLDEIMLPELQIEGEPFAFAVDRLRAASIQFGKNPEEIGMVFAIDKTRLEKYLLRTAPVHLKLPKGTLRQALDALSENAKTSYEVRGDSVVIRYPESAQRL